MGAVLKLLVLPSLFIVPWLWMKLGNEDILVRELLTSQPHLVGAALVPGAFVFVIWILRR